MQTNSFDDSSANEELEWAVPSMVRRRGGMRSTSLLLLPLGAFVLELEGVVGLPALPVGVLAAAGSLSEGQWSTKQLINDVAL